MCFGRDYGPSIATDGGTRLGFDIMNGYFNMSLLGEAVVNILISFRDLRILSLAFHIITAV
jgi:hypothetical protein